MLACWTEAKNYTQYKSWGFIVVVPNYIESGSSDFFDIKSPINELIN